jgi:hypothetical protein
VVFEGTVNRDEQYISCQEFFTVVFPKISYLERIFSLKSIQEVAEEKGWSKKSLDEVLDINSSVQFGMTKDMVLWK